MTESNNKIILKNFLYYELFTFLNIQKRFIKEINNTICVNIPESYGKIKQSIGVVKFIKLTSKVNEVEKLIISKEEMNHLESFYFNDFNSFDLPLEINFYYNHIGLIPIVNSTTNEMIWCEFKLGHPYYYVYNSENIDLGNIKNVVGIYVHLSGAIDLLMYNFKTGKLAFIERKTYTGDNKSVSMEDLFLKQINIKQITLYVWYFLSIATTFGLSIDNNDVELYITGIHQTNKIVKTWKIEYNPNKYLGIWNQDKWNPILCQSGRITYRDTYCKSCFINIDKKKGQFIVSQNTKTLYCSNRCYTRLENNLKKCHGYKRNCFRTFDSNFKVENQFYCNICYKNYLKFI